MTPPKPKARARRVSLWSYARAFRQDILSAQPEHLYAAKMAEFRTPFFRSVLANDPAILREVLIDRASDFPKSDRVAEGLRPLLGQSVFLTNGAVWEHQRRIIDPAFEGGRLKEAYPSMLNAVQDGIKRLEPGLRDIEPWASHLAADVIFRTLFSVPIEDRLATAVFDAFQDYQRNAPILNVAALFPLPRWVPRLHRGGVRRNARVIRRLIGDMVAQRAEAISSGRAPDDLATKIMTTADPETGQSFSAEEMADQVAIFFLAGHETSASALAWALYLLSTHPNAEARVAEEAIGFAANPAFGRLKSLKFTRDVLREALRLYPPVPMMVRRTTKREQFRDRDLPTNTQVVVSPWHLHRNPTSWENPDGFDPDRWARGDVTREIYLPFSTGPRVCPGAGFAMMEGTLALALAIAAFRLNAVAGRDPVPVAHLTVRGKDGIWLDVSPR